MLLYTLTIHFTKYTCTLAARSGRGTRKLEPVPAGFRQEAGYTIGRLTIYHMANTNNYSYLWAISKKVLSLICMFLGCKWKPEHPEETHAGTGKTCKLSTEKKKPSWLAGLNPLCCLRWVNNCFLPIMLNNYQNKAVSTKAKKHHACNSVSICDSSDIRRAEKVSGTIYSIIHVNLKMQKQSHRALTKNRNKKEISKEVC